MCYYLFLFYLIFIDKKRMVDPYNVDIFLMQLSYLPFREVINMCQVNTKYHNYCTSYTYNNRWKAIIDNTFSNVYNYENKLDKIWQDLGYEKGKYDYMVYVNLIQYLDPITRLMIYYQQKDIDNFNDTEYTTEQRFLALFLIGDKNLIKYLPKKPIYENFVKLLNGNVLLADDLYDMLFIMIKYGNVKGIKYLVEQGADIRSHNDWTLRDAAHYGHLEVVKYLINQGLDVNLRNTEALRQAAIQGHLEIVKYLVEQGAYIHAQDDGALESAKENGYLEVVKYLIEQGN